MGFVHVGHCAIRLAEVEIGGEARGKRYGSAERQVMQHLVSIGVGS